MSLWRSYSSLSPRTKAAVGVSIIAWASLGLFLSDRAEEKFGYTPTEADKAALDKITPKIHVVPRDQEQS